MSKPYREVITGEPAQSFVFKIDRDLWPVYHFHPEVDLLLVLKNHGRYLSGDYVARMEPGSLFMNGPNIPHALHADEPDEQDWDRPALGVVQFLPESLEGHLLAAPEAGHLRTFLRSAERGFEFLGETRAEGGRMIMAMADEEGIARAASLLRLLDFLARSPSEDRKAMASEGYRPPVRDDEIHRIDRVIQHLRDHKCESMNLTDISRVAGLSEKAFCRFFKANTGKTFVRYLNELRVAEAARLLLETDRGVAEVCFESGFGNVSNFNRRFREVHGMAPTEYRRTASPDRSKQGKPMPACR